MSQLDNAQDQIDLIAASILEDLKVATLPTWVTDLAYFSDKEYAASAVDYPWIKVSGQMQPAPEGVQGDKKPPETYITRVNNDRVQLTVPVPLSSLRRASGAGYPSMMAREAVTSGINRLTHLVVDALQNGGTYTAYDGLPFFSTLHETGPNTASVDIASPAAPTEEALMDAVADAMVLIMGQRDGDQYFNRGYGQYRVVLPFRYLKAANGLFTSTNIVEVLKSVLSTEQRGRIDGSSVQYYLDPALSANELFVAVTDVTQKPMILQREFEELQVLGVESDQAKKTGMAEFIFTQHSGLENWRYERIARIQFT
jgi:hypothetical protein